MDFNPRSQPARNERPVRTVMDYEPSLSCSVVPREKTAVVPRDRYVEQDGKRFLMVGGGDLLPFPDDVAIAFEGDPLEGNEDKFDLAIMLGAVTPEHQSQSVLVAGGPPRRAGIGMAILARVPLDEFKRRAREVFAGGSPPDFIDRSAWMQERVRLALEVANGS